MWLCDKIIIPDNMFNIYIDIYTVFYFLILSLIFAMHMKYNQFIRLKIVDFLYI